MVADSGGSDSQPMPHGQDAHQDPVLVEGKQSYVFILADARKAKGHDFVRQPDWPGREHPWEPRVR